LHISAPAEIGRLLKKAGENLMFFSKNNFCGEEGGGAPLLAAAMVGSSEGVYLTRIEKVA